MKSKLAVTFVTTLGLAVTANAQTVQIPQVDRGPAVFIQQQSVGSGVIMRQLPDTARPRPPATTRSPAPQPPMPRSFIEVDEASALPQDWSDISDPDPLIVSEEIPASVGIGVTVILTPPSVDSLPTVGDGAIAL